MSVNVLYRTSAKATGGRDGHAATLDGTLDVKLATPKELGMERHIASTKWVDIELDISLPGVPRADAEALVEKAHQVCPYSNATRGNVDVRLKIV